MPLYLAFQAQPMIRRLAGVKVVRQHLGRGWAFYGLVMLLVVGLLWMLAVGIRMMLVQILSITS